MKKPRRYARTKKTNTYQRYNRLALELIKTIGPENTSKTLRVVANWMDRHMMCGSAQAAMSYQHATNTIQYDIAEALTVPLEEMPMIIDDKGLPGVIARSRLTVCP